VRRDHARGVSIWDEQALKEIPESNRPDATDRLVREFFPAPTERQRKAIESRRAAKRLSQSEAEQLNASGGM
jgi:hypothetical protein